jgi:DNA-binding response OmpR family regulator
MENMEELQETELPGGMHILRNDKKRIVVHDNTITVFTPTEYRLFCLLLNGNIIDDDTLAEEVLSCKEMNRTVQNLLKKHIENTKSKLHVLGLDIYRVHKKGYILMAS